jgi:glycosyltransferase involved in cell wall biosynthesis
MKILIAHNTYQRRGGEDVVFEQESGMLEANGFDVRRFTVGNDHIRGFAEKIATARSIFSNKPSIAALCAEMDKLQPDLVHFHNFFPTLSPASVKAVAERGIPAVVTLHNYRLICVGAYLLRNGKPCEDCVSRLRLPAVIHGCYHDSSIGSTFVAAMALYFRRILKQYPSQITLIALTEFAKSRFVADGFEADRIIVRGNVISDPGVGSSDRERRFLYVGRLSAEKGVDTLLDAARDLDCTLEIIGDGPERSRLEARAGSNVVFLGHIPVPQVIDRMRSALALAVPSRWYEGFPMVILEAMATGTPVLASRIGSLAEIVAHEQTGLLLPPDDASAWHEAMTNLLRSRTSAQALGEKARERFLEKHSIETGMETLAAVYSRARMRLAGQSH